MERKKTEDTVEVLKAMSDFTRFRILTLLAACQNSLCVTALSKKLDVSQPVISQHLKILKNAKIVESKREGYHIHYSLNRKKITDIAKMLNAMIESPSESCIADNCIKKDH